MPVIEIVCVPVFTFASLIVTLRLQTAFALSGMLDPTFLVVQAAGTGKDTSMLEGLMQVEGESRSAALRTPPHFSRHSLPRTKP
jgi:hypothetical protein